MGKQVNFYMIREDELMFLEFVSSKTNFFLIDPKSSQPQVRIIEDKFLTQAIDEKLVQVLFMNKSTIIDQKYLVRHEGRQYVTELAGYIETGEIFYIVDDMNAPVIKYTRSIIQPDNRLSRGRIWAEMNELIDNVFVYKGVEFERSYEQIARWLRRNLVRHKRVPFYLGRKTLQWFEEGGELLP